MQRRLPSDQLADLGLHRDQKILHIPNRRCFGFIEVTDPLLASNEALGVDAVDAASALRIGPLDRSAFLPYSRSVLVVTPIS